MKRLLPFVVVAALALPTAAVWADSDNVAVPPDRQQSSQHDTNQAQLPAERPSATDSTAKAKPDCSATALKPGQKLPADCAQEFSVHHLENP